MAAEIGVALLGAGTVGAAVARALVEDGDRLAAVCGARPRLRTLAVRDTSRSRGVALEGVSVGDDPVAAAAADGVDVVVELMGGIEPARSALTAALRSGRAAVTANKALMAEHGIELAGLAQPASGGLLFEAAVGGGVPMLGLLRHPLRGDRVMSLLGVVNGTTNFMLERMRVGETYAEALAEAQRLGYAEADPGADVDGHDAASKLCLLAWLGMGAAVTPQAVIRTGIRDLDRDDALAAEALGGVLRLVARAERGEVGLALSVQPTVVPRRHPLASLDGAENALLIGCDLAGPITVRGAGAGAGATASAVLGDLVEVIRCRLRGVDAELPAADAGTPLLDAEGAEAAACLRLRVAPDPEAPDAVAAMLADRGVEVAGILERQGELIVLTESCPRALLDRAVETLDVMPAVQAVIRRLDRLEAAL